MYEHYVEDYSLIMGVMDLLPVILFTLAGCIIISCVSLIMIGALKPLSTKLNMSVTTANWVKESINIVAQGTLLIGVYLLNKPGY